MKLFLLILVAIALPVCALADITGTWSGSLESNQDGQNRTESAYLILKQDGATLTGSGGPSEERQLAIRNGKVNGSDVTFEIAMDDDRVMSFVLHSAEESLTGDVSGPDKETGTLKRAKLTLKRVASK